MRGYKQKSLFVSSNIWKHQVSSRLFLNLLSGTVFKNSLGLYFSLYCIGQGPSRALGSFVQALLAVQHN